MESGRTQTRQAFAAVPGAELKSVHSNVTPSLATGPVVGAAGGGGRGAEPADRWLAGFLSCLNAGRLRSLHRLATVAAHLDPLCHTDAAAVDKNKKPPPPPLVGHARLGRLSVQLKKRVKTLVYIENLFDPLTLHALFQVIDLPRFTLANIYEAVARADLSYVVPRERLPLPSDSAVAPFLLLVLYAKLLSNSKGSADVSNLFATLKSLPAQAAAVLPEDFGLPADVFLSALAERRVRFFDADSGSDQGSGAAFLPQRQRSTLYWNEYFEKSELAYLSQAYRNERFVTRVKHSLTGKQSKAEPNQVADLPLTLEDRAYKASRNPEQMAQFEESIARVRDYLAVSPAIVLANMRFLSAHRASLHPRMFNSEMVSLLLDLLETAAEGNLPHSDSTIACCLRLLCTWLGIVAQQIDRGSLRQYAIREEAEQAIKGATIVEQMLPRLSVAGLLFALGVAYLGSTYAVLLPGNTDGTHERANRCYSIIRRCLEQPTAALLRSKALPVLLEGIGNLMISAPLEVLQPITHLLLRLWQVESNDPIMAPQAGLTDSPAHSSRDHDAGLPIVTEESLLVVFRLFRFVFVSRAMSTEGMVAPSPAIAAVEGPNIYQSLPRNWLQVLVSECSGAADPGSPSRHVALFAAGGLLKGAAIFRQAFVMSKEEEGLLEEAVIALAQLLHTAIEEAAAQVGCGHNHAPHWPRTMCLVAINTGEALPLQRSQAELLFDLLLNVCLDDVLDHQWIFSGLQRRDPALKERAFEHRKNYLFKQSATLAQSLALTFASLSVDKAADALTRILAYTEALFEGWRTHVVNASGNAVPPALMPELMSFAQTIFLSFNYLFNLVADQRIDPHHCILALRSLSFLQFARIKLNLYDATAYRLILRAADDDSMLPIIADLLFVNSARPEEDLWKMDELTTGRFYFFLDAMEVVINCFSLDILQQRLLPLLFALIGHSHILLNKKAHLVLKTLFSGTTYSSEEAREDPIAYSASRSIHAFFERQASAPIFTSPPRMPQHVMKLVPYYLNLCLKYYGERLPFESFAECFQTILFSLPPSHPLVLFCFQALADKAKEILCLECRTPCATSLPYFNEEHQPQNEEAEEQQHDQHLEHSPTIQRTKDSCANDDLAALDQSKPLLMLMSRNIAWIDIQDLERLLDTLDQLLQSVSSKRVQTVLCKYIYHVISTNYDYTRKHVCLAWYLRLLASLKLNAKTMVIQTPAPPPSVPLSSP